MDTLEDDANQVFMIFVPSLPGTDNTIESCIRLGSSPAASNQETADENKTYSDAVGVAEALSGLSLDAYQSANGIALLTPGTITQVAANGVNTTCGNYSHSTIGDSYVVTQNTSNGKPSYIVSASYTYQPGLWATVSFNQATTVTVNVLPLQASILVGPSYSVNGPLTFTNSIGAMWNSTIGFSVNAQLARVTNIGWRTIVSNDWDGSSNQYYTLKQTSTNAAGFSWTVPMALRSGTNGGWSYKQYDELQNTWCKAVTLAAVATDALAVAYALAGAIIADSGSPEKVKSWLKGGEPVAIICTALDGLLCVGGILLSYLFVDKQAKDANDANSCPTSITMGDGNIELTAARAIQSDPAFMRPKLTLNGSDGIALVTQTGGPGATITLNGDEIKISATTITISGKVNFNPPDPSSPVNNAPTTPKSIGLTGDGNNSLNDNVPVNWGAPNWPPKPGSY
jgi:hypothetical protein